MELSRRRERIHLVAMTELRDFWAERLLCTYAATRADGSIHLTPVGATLEAERELVRIITSRSSVKARNLTRNPGSLVAVSQVDGRRWSTIEGTATVSDDPERVAEAVARYAERYRTPRPNPERVVIEIQITRYLGTIAPEPAT